MAEDQNCHGAGLEEAANVDEKEKGTSFLCQHSSTRPHHQQRHAACGIRTATVTSSGPVDTPIHPPSLWIGDFLFPFLPLHARITQASAQALSVG